jgi:CRISPR-associated endonuclease/helicase Cas3
MGLRSASPSTPRLSEAPRSACSALLTQPTRLSQQWLRFFGVAPERFASFVSNVQLAALFHDLGKANDRFQAALLGRDEQAIRHEHLSGLLLHLEPLRSWLEAARPSGVDAEIVIAAVVSHHLKVNHEHFARRLLEGNPAFTVFASAPEFTRCLTLAAELIGTPPPDVSAWQRRWSFDLDVEPLKDGFKRAMHNFNRAVRQDDARRRLLVAVKAALIAADSAGSALVREGQSIPGWIDACFGGQPLTAHWISAQVVGPRLEEIERTSGRTFQWHDFQIAAGKLGPRALLLAGCGTGKTLAAWRWIMSQLERRPASRVIFLYPTRGTATEGFRDYVSWAGGQEAALMHGTAAYDLDGIVTNPGDPRAGGDYQVNDRLFALGYWPKRVFSATVDSFLAFVRNRYSSLCLLPVLSDSILVVDEVHSFDPAMFTALERFLNFFDIPVLCMTASLPPGRLRVLRGGCGLEVFPASPAAFADLDRQSQAPRYRLATIAEEDAAERVADALASGKRRVLWVVNTVRRCQERARLLATRLPEDVALCYHSRFRLSDRRQRHNDIIARFRADTPRPLVVVATQVCEMSLDLDADVLVTEFAPVPSLIQRMGRCCRLPYPGNRLGVVYAYAPRDFGPYDRADIEGGEAFVEAMLKRQRAISHADLADCLAAVPHDPVAEGAFTGFLDAGAYAMSSEEAFREGNDFTVDCVLDSDVDSFLAARRRRDSAADGFIVPVPRRFARVSPRLGRYLREAAWERYDGQLGFVDEEVGSV